MMDTLAKVTNYTFINCFSSSLLVYFKENVFLILTTINNTKIKKNLKNNSKKNRIQNLWPWFICLKTFCIKPMKLKKNITKKSKQKK